MCVAMGISTPARSASVAGGGGRADAFHYRPAALQRVGHALPAADGLAEGPVPREVPGTGQDEVAEAGEPGQRVRPPAEATARRVISARPRVTRAATVLWP